MASAISKSKRQRLSNVFDQQSMAFSSPTGPGALDPFAASSPVNLGFPTTPPVAAVSSATPAGVRTSARRSAAKAKQTPVSTKTPAVAAKGTKKFIVERQAPPKKLVFEETWNELGSKTAAAAGKSGNRNPSPPPARVLGSDGEEVVVEGKQTKQRRGAGSKKSKPADIYEVPDDSEDELKLNGAAKHQPKEKQQKKQEPEKKKGGRQTKKQKEAAAAAAAAAEAGTDGTKEPPTPKKRGRPKKADRIAAEADKGTGSPATAPVKAPKRQPKTKKKKAEISDSEEEPDTIIDDQLFADLDYEHEKKKESQRQELKGILSPRKKRLDERKTVAWDEDEEEEQEEEEQEEEEDEEEGVVMSVTGSFEGLPTKKTKRTSREVDIEPESETVVDEIAATEDEEVDSEADGSNDDEVCVICSNPDTKRGNQIVFCDGCDKAVHQKCYGIPRLPKGDWYCKECLELGKDKEPKEAAPSTATRKEEKTIATVEAIPEEKAPDIPNFERHLRCLQRVLIDRCTGRRRIKLRGQEEAYAKTCQLVEQTIVAGEGNSMMVIGARGSGKTTVSCPLLQYMPISSLRLTMIIAARRIHHIRHVRPTQGRIPRRPIKRLHPHRRQASSPRDLAPARQGDGRRGRPYQQDHQQPRRHHGVLAGALIAPCRNQHGTTAGWRDL